MKMHYALFKCRLCGETYITSGTGDRKTAMKSAINAAIGKVTDPQAPELHDIHVCENGGIGIGDFIGFKEGTEDG